MAGAVVLVVPDRTNAPLAATFDQLIPDGNRSVSTTSLVRPAGVLTAPFKLRTVLPPGPAPRVPNDLDTPSCGVGPTMRRSAEAAMGARGTPASCGVAVAVLSSTSRLLSEASA